MYLQMFTVGTVFLLEDICMSRNFVLNVMADRPK